jgi:hypothetical protein
MSAARRKWSAVTTTGALVATLAVLPQLAEAATQSTNVGPGDSTRMRPARTVHEIPTTEVGVRRPTGLTYDPAQGTLLVTGALPKGGSEVVAVTPAEKPRGREVRRALGDGVTAAFDPKTDQLTARTAGVAHPAGSAYTPDGTLHVLDAANHAIVSVAPDGTVSRTALPQLAGRTLRGLAYQPDQRLLYVADTSGARDTIYGLDASGSVVRSQDITDAKVANLQAMTFAPSADATDPAAEQNLFVADAGTATSLGRVAELTLAPAAAAAPSISMGTSRKVETGAAGTWSPNSPDPAGITYDSETLRLLVSDSEVDEIPGLFTSGKNLWTTSLAGVVETPGTTVTNPATGGWSSEPTGVAYDRPHGQLYVSDDDLNRIYIVPGPGIDKRWGTADDSPPTNISSSAIGATDNEDVAYDSKRNNLVLIDGVNDELYRLNPGPNGIFDGIKPGSDDVATHTDLERFGIVNPEGVTYDSARDVMVVVDNKGLWELGANGALIDAVDVSPLGLMLAAGVAVAPASDGSGKTSYYIVDRGKDNNIVPTENDGRLFEVTPTMPAIGDRPPLADAGPDTVADVGESVQLAGSGTDDDQTALSSTWSKVSGTGTATFAAGTSAASGVSFSAPGTYVLRLTVSDGSLTSTDDVTVKVSNPGASRTVSVPITVSSDDAQEGGLNTTGGQSVRIDSPDDELGSDGTDPMLTGFRFPNIPIPYGSQVDSAKIQFGADEVNASPAAFTITGEAADNAATYRTTANSISTRPKVGSVAWAPPAWNTVKESGAAQLTPELKTIAQAVVDRAGWRRGNAMAFMVSGSGRRTALSFDGGLGTPTLVLTYRTPSTPITPPPTPTPSAPSLSLRTSAPSLTAGGAVTLSGTVTRSGTAVAGQAVDLFAARAPGFVEQRVKTVTTGAGGGFSVTDKPSTTTRYVVRAAGGASPAMSVVVRPRVTAGLSRGVVHRNRPVYVRGSVLPGSSGQRVYLQRGVGKRWVSVKRGVTTSSYRFGLRPTRVGSYRYRVVASANAGRAAATSRILRLRVIR